MTFEYSQGISPQLKNSFNDFVSKYNQLLETRFPNIRNVNFKIAGHDSGDFNFDPNSPLEINTDERFIFVNNIAEFTKDEIHSLIAHEIGHYIYCESSTDNEVDCDNIAVYLGLKDAMRRALAKTISTLEEKEKIENQLGFSSYSNLIDGLKHRLGLLI